MLECHYKLVFTELENANSDMPSRKIRRGCNVMGRQGSKFIPYKLFLAGISTFTFCKELWPKQNSTQFLWGPFKGRVQNGISGSYMYAVFKLVAHEESEIWTSVPHSYTKEGLL